MGCLTRPVRRLKHFAKQDFKPGATRALTFTIPPGKALSYPDASGQRRREVGFFMRCVGGQPPCFRYVGTTAKLVGRR